MEGRDRATGNAGQQTRVRTQRRAALSRALDRVRQAATDTTMRLTALWHPGHAIDRRREASSRLKHDAAPGGEGQTWATSGAPRETKLRELSDRRKRGASQAPPGERVSSPQADGRQRPIGQPTLEDTSVQRATVEVLNAIDEEEWVGFSDGARPGRHPHHAVEAVRVGRATRRLPWVLAADRRGFSEAMDHAWLGQFVAHRLGDQRVVRHSRTWLKAGVLEDGQWRQPAEGPPHGGSASPLRAHLSLHEVCALWAAPGRRRPARGDGISGRDGADGMGGCQHRAEAEQWRSERRERGHRCHRALPPEKTRLIAWGRSARKRRQRRGQGTPETCDFLGWPHLCGTPKRGPWTVRRWTLAQRRRKKLQEVKQTRRARMHWPLEKRGAWLTRGVSGHSRSDGGPRNLGRLWVVRERLLRYWCRI